MYTIIASASGNGFVLNGAAPRPKGSQYELTKHGDNIGIREVTSNEPLASPKHYSEWNSGAYANVQEAIDAIELLIYSSSSGGGTSDVSIISPDPLPVKDQGLYGEGESTIYVESSSFPIVIPATNLYAYDSNDVEIDFVVLLGGANLTSIDILKAFLESISGATFTSNSTDTLTVATNTIDVVKYEFRSGGGTLYETFLINTAEGDKILVDISDKLTALKAATDNVISTSNSTATTLGAGADFTGAWEDVTNYNTVSSVVLGSVATDGTLFFDVSTNGGVTFTSIPNNISDTTFSLPRILNVVESHVRVRYINGTTPQAGTFSIQTKFSVNQQMSLLSSVDGIVNGETPTSVVKAVNVGADPNGDYVNSPQAGVDNNNSTSTPLGIAGVFTGVWSRVDAYGEIKVAMVTDVIGDCLLQLSHDGITVDTSLNLPPQPVGGNYSFIHALNPSLPYFRVVYTNGATAQSSFDFTTILLPTTGNGFVSRTTQVIDKYTDAKVVRQANDPTLDRNLGLLNYQVSARKFGKNNSVGNGALETVWAGADLGGALNYVFAQAAETLRIKAGGNAADTAAGLGAQSIRITGLDQDWNEAVEIVATAGASASAATTTTFIAVNKVQVVDVGTYGVANTGDIIVENTSTGLELAYVPAGVGNTQQAIFSVPAGKTAYVTKIKISVGLSDSADIIMYHIDKADDVTGPAFGAKHYEWGLEDFSGSRDFDLDTYLKFDEKNHIYMEAQRVTGSGSAQVSVDFEMYLVDNN